MCGLITASFRTEKVTEQAEAEKSLPLSSDGFCLASAHILPFASSREKKSGENDGSSWCPFLCVSNYVGSQNVSCEKV